MIVTKGLGSNLLISKGYGSLIKKVIALIQRPPKYVLHGFNRMRLLQWGGRFRPK